MPHYVAAYNKVVLPFFVIQC